jgi:hypothetical protein
LEEESIIRYKISQITDTGSTISMAISEDIELENVSQQQMMLEAIDRAITDKEVKEQIKPNCRQDLFTNNYSHYNAKKEI